MAKRRAVWTASDIRDWGGSRQASRSEVKTAPAALDPDAMVQVKTGKQEWPTRLRWVMDLLDKRETNALQTALSKGRPLALAAKAGRAAMTITAPVEMPAATPVAANEETEAASPASQPSPVLS